MTKQKEMSLPEKQFHRREEKHMAGGMRDNSRYPLSDEEIELIRQEIRRINADESLFIFNDPEHIWSGTTYNFLEDRIYVNRNVFPDNYSGSKHPRDKMSIAAVLAHEYYGHRPYREEYWDDYRISSEYHTHPYWEDESRASLTAAKIAPNLTQQERCDLVEDAIFRSKECGHVLEMDDFMKEVIYGYSDEEKNDKFSDSGISQISEESVRGVYEDREDDSSLSDVWYDSYYYDDGER